MPGGSQPKLPWHRADFRMDVAEMCQRGLTRKTIARRLGTSVRSLDIFRARYGLPMHRTTAADVARRLGVAKRKFLHWVHTGWIRAQQVGQGTEHRRYHITDESLFRFLQNPAYWPHWRVEDVTDAGLREWARELRAAGGVWLDCDAVAERFSVTPKAVNRWVSGGIIPAICATHEAGYLIREADLSGFVPPIERPRQGNGRRWTDSDNRLLIDARGRGRPFSAIAPSVGRTAEACAIHYRELRAGRTPLPPGYTLNHLASTIDIQALRGQRKAMNDTERAQLYARWQAGDYRNIYDAGRAWGISHETARTIINAGLAAEGKPAPGKGRRANRAA